MKNIDSSATDQSSQTASSTAGERADYLLGGIYNAGAAFSWPREKIEAALVRNLGWAPLKAQTLVGLWMTTLPYRNRPNIPNGTIR